ncbi:hypothetical protein RMCBS344292_02826 [Rhizopus microsporus]|nr:hypothetical protein RMCBS344292_02826 [Rhizopus microsporus]
METPFWNNPNGTSASKYAPSQPSQPPQHQRPQQQPTQTWRQQPHTQPQQQQHWNQQQQQQQQQPQAPSWSQPQTQQVPSWQQQQQQPLGTMASKYATAAPSQSPVQTQPPQYQQQQQQQQHYMPPAAPNTPCLTFKIELAPGVTANLPVYPNDNPSDVVSQFEKNHHLVMSDAAKARFAERVAMLLSQYNK